MADYRRCSSLGSTFFFTLVTKHRARFLCGATARQILGEVMRQCRSRWPFETEAIVLLPDHLHCIWSLPEDDCDYSRRWAWIKKEFTKSWLLQGGREQPISIKRQFRGDRGVWQPRFWEHLLRDETDFENHLDYIHYNPVKHGLAQRPVDWPFSSLRRWIAKGVYPKNWACGLEKPPDFSRLNESAME